MNLVRIKELSDEKLNDEISEAIGYTNTSPRDWSCPTAWAHAANWVGCSDKVKHTIDEVGHPYLEEYPFALGLVLFGENTNANDWVIYRMLTASPREMAEALLLVLSGGR
jgi:hypothetical protein